MKAKRITALAVTVLFVSGCATTYGPKQNALLKSTSKGYERDDQVYKKGIFNQGLVKATEGNSEAQAYAKKSSNNAAWAFGLVTGGLASVGAGAGLAAVSDKHSSGYSAGGDLMLVGIIALLGSLIPSLKIQPYQQNAINKYNDDVFAGAKGNN